MLSLKCMPYHSWLRKHVTRVVLGALLISVLRLNTRKTIRGRGTDREEGKPTTIQIITESTRPSAQAQVPMTPIPQDNCNYLAQWDSPQVAGNDSKLSIARPVCTFPTWIFTSDNPCRLDIRLYIGLISPKHHLMSFTVIYRLPKHLFLILFQ